MRGDRVGLVNSAQHRVRSAGPLEREHPPWILRRRALTSSNCVRFIPHREDSPMRAISPGY
jgi:hypothetical protein